MYNKSILKNLEKTVASMHLLTSLLFFTNYFHNFNLILKPWKPTNHNCTMKHYQPLSTTLKNLPLVYFCLLFYYFSQIFFHCKTWSLKPWITNKPFLRNEILTAPVKNLGKSLISMHVLVDFFSVFHNFFSLEKKLILNLEKTNKP